MTGKTKKTFEHLLTAEQTTARGLLERAAKIAELDTLVRQCLPTPLAEHCQVVNVRNSKLILKLDSPAWATQLRFSSTALLSTLRQNPNFAGLAGIDFYVKPETAAEKKTVSAIAKRPTLSASAKQSLLNTAATVSNPQLRAVLEKIAAR